MRRVHLPDHSAQRGAPRVAFGRFDNRFGLRQCTRRQTAAAGHKFTHLEARSYAVLATF